MQVTNTAASLGAAIQNRRRSLGITQDDLALSIGVNRRVIGQLEKGKGSVQLQIVLRAVQALGLNIGVETRGQ